MAISAKIRKVPKILAARRGGFGEGFPRALQIYPVNVDRKPMAAMSPTNSLSKTDPRRLRGMMERASDLARGHQVTSVFVGIAGREGDFLAPEFIDFVESELRMEDAVFRLIRERAVVLLTDVDKGQAEEIFKRLRSDFLAQFGSSTEFEVELGYFQINGQGGHATAKVVLPAIFRSREGPEEP
jgi:hypothetical protein